MPGSFRLAISTPHLHGEFNFIEIILETVGQSLRHSCRTPIKCQGISLPLDRQITAAVYWGLKSKPKLFLLILQHWAGVSLYTSFYKFAKTCDWDR